MRLRPLLLCLLLGAQVHAQSLAPADAPLLPAPTLQLEVDKPVRILRGNLLLEGRLLETDRQFLTLDSGIPGAEPVQVPLSDVRELSVRKRSPGYGALIGGAAGLVTGSLAGLFLCGVAEGATTGQCLAIVGLSSATLGLAGTGLGAFIGLLAPHWERVYERILDGPLVLPSAQVLREQEAPPQEGAGAPPPTAIAQFSVLASSILTLAEPDDALGPGLRIEALAQLGRHIAVGPEVAFHYLVESLDGGSVNEGIFSFGLLMRAAMSPGVVTPSLLVGFSLHTAGQPATYSVGGALDWEGPYGLPFVLELRWHQFNVPWKDGRQLTLGAGTRLYW
jgi:hypothetical protein